MDDLCSCLQPGGHSCEGYCWNKVQVSSTLCASQLVRLLPCKGFRHPAKKRASPARTSSWPTTENTLSPPQGLAALARRCQMPSAQSRSLLNRIHGESSACTCKCTPAHAVTHHTRCLGQFAGNASHCSYGGDEACAPYSSASPQAAQGTHGHLAHSAARRTHLPPPFIASPPCQSLHLIGRSS